ncbi:hypothetical protein SARC_07291, partial [Sphaeroforma arctica JP610]
GHYARAIQSYTDAIDYDSTECTYYSNRAMAYLKVGEWERVVEDCDTALSIDPKNVKALMRRATSRTATGADELAIADFRAVLKIEPTNTQAKSALEKLSAPIGSISRKTGPTVPHAGTSVSGTDVKAGAEAGERRGTDKTGGTVESLDMSAEASATADQIVKEIGQKLGLKGKSQKEQNKKQAESVPKKTLIEVVGETAREGSDGVSPSDKAGGNKQAANSRVDEKKVEILDDPVVGDVGERGLSWDRHSHQQDTSKREMTDMGGEEGHAHSASPGTKEIPVLKSSLKSTQHVSPKKRVQGAALSSSDKAKHVVFDTSKNCVRVDNPEVDEQMVPSISEGEMGTGVSKKSQVRTRGIPKVGASNSEREGGIPSVGTTRGATKGAMVGRDKTALNTDTDTVGRGDRPVVPSVGAQWSASTKMSRANKASGEGEQAHGETHHEDTESASIPSPTSSPQQTTPEVQSKQSGLSGTQTSAETGRGSGTVHVGAGAGSEHVVVRAPQNAVEFERAWKEAKNAIYMRYALLQSIGTELYARVFSTCMDEAFVASVLDVLSTCYKRDHVAVYPVLVGLSGVPRFSLAVMFMSTAHSQMLEGLLEYVRAEESVGEAQFAALKKAYA